MAKILAGVPGHVRVCILKCTLTAVCVGGCVCVRVYMMLCKCGQRLEVASFDDILTNIEMGYNCLSCSLPISSLILPSYPLSISSSSVFPSPPNIEMINNCLSRSLPISFSLTLPSPPPPVCLILSSSLPKFFLLLPFVFLPSRKQY